jgi:predicted metal-dependent peptidase
MTKFEPVELTYEQKEKLETMRIGFMAACPFYAHYFYAEMNEVFTTGVKTAATDGRNIFLNPNYMQTLKISEGVFVYAHEVEHVICKHPQRMKHHAKEGTIGSHPYECATFNECADYVINANLLDEGVGSMNPSWLFAQDVDGNDIAEEVYERKYKTRPPGGGGGPNQGSTFGQSSKSPKGAQRDKTADADGGHMDEVLEPPVDPVTGQEDLPTESEFKEAIARAAAVAKAAGKLSDSMAKRVEEMLEPQIDWAEHIRLLLTGKIGSRKETWDRPNRRRLALNPIIITPGRRGHGADTVAVAIDTSGSIYASPKALEAFFAEVGGILQDIRPKRIVMIEVDAEVKRVREASSLDDLSDILSAPVKGGGGTRFEPFFEYLEREQIKPEAAIYLTDLRGSFPDTAPDYPVVWASIEDGAAPFGDTVRIQVKG